MAAIDVERVVGNAVIELIRKNPFYGTVISQLPRVFTAGITPTLAVGRQKDDFLITLYVNPDYVRDIYARAADHRRAFSHLVEVLKHETIHIAFEHIFKKPAPNAYAHAMACECATNSYVNRGELLDGGVFASDFGLPDRLGYDRYYQEIVKKMKSPKKAAASGAMAGGGANGNDAGDDKGKNGKTGSGGGSGASGGNGKSDGGKDASGGGNAGSGDFDGQLDSHALWAETIAEGKDSAAGLLVGDILRKAREAAKDTGAWGDVPGEIREALDDALDAKPPRVAWQSVLRDFLASASESVLGYTNRRLSRRYGTRPGTYKENVLNLAIGVDTSGSIDMDDLREFFSEIRQIERAGAEITVFECDTIIHREYPFAQFDPSRPLSGGGGTNLEPVFRTASERRFDALIYFTDGYAPKIYTDYRIPTILVGNAGGNALHRANGGFVYPPAAFVFILGPDGQVDVE